MAKGFLMIILTSMVCLCARPQMAIDGSVCTGSSYVSEGQYTKLASWFSYKDQCWDFSAAAGAVFSQAREKQLDAIRLSLSRDQRIGDKLITPRVFYQFSPVSVRLNDQTAGLLFNHKSRRWYFDLGANTRWYSFTKRYKGMTGYTDKVLWEPINIMYRLTWHKPFGDKFEINPAVTNFDHFMIEQETNPFIMMNVLYKLNEKSRIYVDGIYQQAGFFNIRVNYFGYYLRAGCQLNVGRKRDSNIRLKPIDL